MLDVDSMGGPRGLCRALLGALTCVLPGQLVHQVGFARAVEAHNGHHHHRLLDGRQDPQGLLVGCQLPFHILNEAHGAWHVDL